jgi:L-asparaginase
VVAMNDEIHAARRVAKAHTASPAAFVSPGFGPLGHVAEGQAGIPVRLRERSPLFNRVPRRRVRARKPTCWPAG